jgi:hypothetical protein
VLAPNGPQRLPHRHCSEQREKIQLHLRAGEPHAGKAIGGIQVIEMPGKIGRRALAMREEQVLERDRF